MTTVPPVAEGPSDAELITRVRGGDNAAYGQLWERHLDAARRLSRQLANGAEADDLVSESFAKVLSTLQNGGGPDAAFRAYLLTSMRNTFYDKIKRDKRLQLQEDMSTVDPGVPFVDTAVEGLESSLAARAFASLPERWQTVLWHTEIEGETPAEVAPVLGLTANGVSALAYRAREGLRQAYLQVHLADTASVSCQSTVERLGAYVRKGLSKRENAQVESHLKSCVRCKALYAELTDVNHGLRGIIAAIVVGSPFVAGYLGLGGAIKGAAVAGGTAAGGAAAAKGGVLAWVRWPHSGPGKAAAAAGAAAGAAAAVIAALALTGGGGHENPHHAAAPLPQRPAPSTPQHPERPRHHRPKPSQHPVAHVRVAPPVKHNAAPPTGHAPGTTPPPSPPPGSRAPTTTPPSAPVPPPRPPQSPPATPPSSPPAPVLPQLHSTVQPVGALVTGQSGILAIDVANAGTQATGPLLADVSTPAGVTPGAVDGAGWTRSERAARPAAALEQGRAVPAVGLLRRSTATVTDDVVTDDGTTAAAPAVVLDAPPLPPGGSTTAYLRVDVATDAPLGGQTQITLHNADNSFHQTVRTTSGVQDSGLSAAYASRGPADTVGIGNTLLTCPKIWRMCGRALTRTGPQSDNDDWLRLQPTGGPAGPAASAADLDLPAGSSVAWARLSWSGEVCGCSSDRTGMLRHGDTGGFTPIAPEEMRTATLGPRRTFQASADVTDLVRSGGRWWFAQPRRPAAALGDYAGWSLVVAVTGPGLPERKVVVFDGFTAVQQGGSRSFTLSGIDGGPATVTAVAWDGDAGLTGDSLTIDGVPLGSANLFDSTAAGAVPDQNTFGVDVQAHPIQLPPTQNHTLLARTGQDAYLLGMLAVAVP